MSGRGVTADVAILEIAQGSFEYRDGGRQWPSEQGAGTPDHGLPLSRRRTVRGRPSRAGYHGVMRRAQVVALLSGKREEIAERFGVRSLSIFGSTARDEARPDSDVDVLVEFVGPVTFDAHMGLLVYLEDLLGRRVDVVTASGLKSRLRPLIEQDLVRVA